MNTRAHSTLNSGRIECVCSSGHSPVEDKLRLRNKGPTGSGVFDEVGFCKLLAVAVAEPALREDGSDGVHGAQVDLNELGGLGIDERAGTPRAARHVHVEPARVGADATRLVARARSQLGRGDPPVLEPEWTAAVACRKMGASLKMYSAKSDGGGLGLPEAPRARPPLVSAVHATNRTRRTRERFYNAVLCRFRSSGIRQGLECLPAEAAECRCRMLHAAAPE